MSLSTATEGLTDVQHETSTPSLVSQITRDGEKPMSLRPRIDCPEEIVALERRHLAGAFILEAYQLPNLTELDRAIAPITSPEHAVDHMTNQFTYRLLGSFMLDNPDSALKVFRGLQPHTTSEEMALLLNDEQFASVHAKLHSHLSDSQADIERTVADRLRPKTGQISKTDKYQFNGNVTDRSLPDLLDTGITIKVAPEHIGDLKTARLVAEQNGLPVTEVVKNERMLIANGFPDSKVSLAIHDTMDHAWGFWLLKKQGLSTKFRTLFESIGDPERTDIYKREGEITASICFGVRFYATQEPGFVPLFTSEFIKQKFEEYFDDGKLESQHMEAFRILRQMPMLSREWQSLGFVFSNYVVELDEQRRKFGKIKQRDLETKEVVGELDTLSPDFLALFIELHHELLASRNKHRDELFRSHLLFEEYLSSVANNTTNPDDHFRIHVQNLQGYDYKSIKVKPKVIRWMFDNYGFSSTKKRMG